ncbi:MAG: hypothetical protein LRY41_01715 [Candidatus Pacebacteria bacterium]|nr:hypothetical protein [Candidatus Paceibacterota bacterium]MCD8507824.1 hypothetical protein [Candidatus Paceibacterota bacterium]MCD8528028.1 hypothetical protein [Candidatus Paceibacterota bacterium]MCD8563890.1 hypothetical protein [Candidatus Paceibacterota bacterium]
MNDRIKKHIEALLPKMGFEVQSISIDKDSDLDTTIFSVMTNDPALLIGKNGDILQAVNHIIRRFAEQDPEFDTRANFYIDVNNYHQRILDDLKTKARIVAERAQSFKSDIALDPMPAYHRLVVHAYIQKYPELATESRGEGKDRHVVIIYKG